MSLIESVQQAETATRNKSLDEYRRHLVKNDQSDVKPIRRAMAELGIGPERLEADAALLAQEALLESRIAENDAPDLESQRAAAVNTWGEYSKETKRLASERFDEESRLNVAVAVLTGRVRVVDEARRALITLRKSRPELFGQQPANV